MKEIYFNNYAGGYNDTIPLDNLADNELCECKNALVSKTRGGIKKRPGCVKVNTVSYNAEVNQIFEIMLSNGSSYMAAIISNGTTYDLCLISDVDGAKTIAKSGIGPKIPYVIYMDQVYFIDYTNSKYYIWGYYKFLASSGTQTVAQNDVVKYDYPNSQVGIKGHYYKALGTYTDIDLFYENYKDITKWTDVTYGTFCNDIIEVTPDADPTNDLSPIQKCKYLEWHQPSMRFFAAGNEDAPTALYFSEVGKPNFFKSTNKVFPITSAGPIVGIEFSNESILVAYKNTWYHFTGTFPGIDAVWKPISIQFGAVSNDAIMLTPESVTFVSDQAIYVFSPAVLSDNYAKVVGESSFADVSSGKVRNTVLGMAKKDLTKIVYFDRTVFIAYNDNPSLDYANCVLVMDWDSKAYVTITGWQVNGWCARSNGYLYFASKNYILWYDHIGLTSNHDIDVDTGENTAIVMSIFTKAYNLSSYHEKTVYSSFVTTEHEINNTDKNTSIYLITDDDSSDYAKFEVFNKVKVPFGAYNLTNHVSEINRTGFRHQFYILDNNIDNYLLICVIGLTFDEINDTNDANEAEQDLLITD